MSMLKAGFSTVNIDPKLGVGIYGYYVPRFAKGILDSLEINALALSSGDTAVILISVDNGGLPKDISDKMSEKASERTGLPAENIIVSSTHSHTAPVTFPTKMFDVNEDDVTEYRDFIIEKGAEAAALAYADLLPAKMGYAIGKAPDRIAYIRRYRMKDGSTMTCPPINDPDIVGPIGELDQRVNVLRFTREGGEDIVLLNYGLHADTVNGELISADWPGVVRRTVAKVLDGTKCIVFTGAEGDVGSTNVHPLPGDMNDTEISFDNEMKSPGMARFIGRALTGTILQVYDKVAYTDDTTLKIVHKDVKIPANVPSKEDLPRAHEYKKLHEEGRDDLIPYSAMELTTVVAEAIRMCELENGPDYFTLNLVGIRIGGAAFVGIPGEPFTDIGVGIKETEGFDIILPAAITNGYAGYFPMMSAYDEGGYEARSSRYKPGVAELIIECGKAILEELK